MLPKEISEILLNHQTGNERLLNDINLSISTIKCILQESDDCISKEGSSTSVEESKILQDYMESIQFIGEWKPAFDE